MNDKTKDLTKSEIADDVVPQTIVNASASAAPATSDTSDNLDTDLDSDNAQYIASIADAKDETGAAEATTPAESTPDTSDTPSRTSDLSSSSANATLSASAGLGSTSNTPQKAEKPAKKKTDIKLDAASLRAVGNAIAKQFLRYAAILFFLLVAVVYGFVVLRINTLSNAQPSQSDIDAQTTTTPIPRIDPNTAKRLENLEDNSQNVQTLFDEARKNPFD